MSGTTGLRLFVAVDVPADVRTRLATRADMLSEAMLKLGDIVDQDLGDFVVREAVLYRSERLPQGPVYEAIARLALSDYPITP